MRARHGKQTCFFFWPKFVILNDDDEEPGKMLTIGASLLIVSSMSGLIQIVLWPSLKMEIGKTFQGLA